MLISKTYWGGMPFWFRRAPEHAHVESLVLRAHDLRQLRALYWTSTAHPAPKIGVVVIHPRVDFTQHYAIPRLLEAGFAVLAAQTRHAGNDTMAEHEEMVLDVGACVRHLLDKRGVEHVVLFGNCGGGSLSAFYQAQAQTSPANRLQTSPGGFPTHFEGATLPAADAVIYTAPHRGQGNVMLAAIDPSVTDERDPLSCDPTFDMYNPANGFRTPPAWSEYAPEFLAKYRAAQRARVERLDAYARDQIAQSRDAVDPRRKAHEPVMVVYRTMANPAFVDRSIDPSERDYGSLLSERPDLMNYAALGLARTCTPRAWLSTWSGLSSNADLVKNVGKITVPTLLVHAGRDREIYPSDIDAIGNGMASADKKIAIIPDARHYFEGDFGDKEAPHVEACMDVVVPWIQERFATPGRKRRLTTEPAVVQHHSTTATWTFPPPTRIRLSGGLERINLKELAARPERFEHHLIVVARLGCAQLEIATASEPLYFAHVNISDEYAVALPTGDPLLDAFPMRTFVSDRVTGADVGRYNHHAGDLVLHPHGFAHWPGKLRPPFQGLEIPPGMRRCALSLVYCANVPTPSTAPIVQLPAGRKPDDVKPYIDPPPSLSLAALLNGTPGVIAKIGNTDLELVERPSAIAPPRGGWVVILAGSAPHAACDLIRVPRGGVLAGNGIERALVLAGDAEPDAVPQSWTALPAAPFPRYEDGAPGALPFEYGHLRIQQGVDPSIAMVTVSGGPMGPGPLEGVVAAVPRYWLARMLFRVALHDVRLNYVETYQGFFVDDSGDDVAIGVRTSTGRQFVTVPRANAKVLLERLYRAVAPPGYTERLA